MLAQEKPPKTIVIQPGDSQEYDFPRENRFWTVFIAMLCPAVCSSCCLTILALPYLVIPAVKGPGTEFCNGYWKEQSNAQLGGMVNRFCC